jgi:hypothetical protein
MRYFYDTILLDEVKDSGRFTLRPFQHDVVIPEDLAASFAISGIIHPPILLQTQQGHYDVVCGRKRLLAIESLFRKKSFCCRLLQQDTSIEEILVIIIEDQFCQGGLNIMEQAGCMALCNAQLPDEISQQQFLATLPKGRITKGTHFLLALNQLMPTIQRKIFSNVLSEKIAASLCNFTEQDQYLVLDIIEQLQIGGNNQRKLLDRLIDLTRRDHITLATLLRRTKLQSILSDSELQGGQKGRAFLEEIYRMSHPLFSEAEISFEDVIRKMALPGNWHVAPARSFETDEVFLTIRYSTLEEFTKKGAAMAAMLQDTTISRE